MLVNEYPNLYKKYSDELKKIKNFDVAITKESKKRKISVDISIDEWILHYKETYEKYKDLHLDDKDYDKLFLTAKLGYFHYLANYALNAMGAYVDKLKEECLTLKSQRKIKKLSKRYQRSKTTKLKQ